MGSWDKSPPEFQTLNLATVSVLFVQDPGEPYQAINAWDSVI